MNLLNELLMLAEAKGKNLLGLTINDKKITKQTPSEPWPGDFGCSANQLISLEFCPKEVGGDFSCSGNKLTSLKGAPSSVSGYFNCYDNQLTSLADIHKCLKKMNGGFYAHKNPLKSNVIGLMLVVGCNEVQLDNVEVMNIMNKHFKSPFGHLRLLECQSELLEAGLEEYAKL